MFAVHRHEPAMLVRASLPPAWMPEVNSRPGMEARSTQKVFGERWLAEIEIALCLWTFRGRGSADFLGMSGSEGRNAGGPRDKFLGKRLGVTPEGGRRKIIERKNCGVEKRLGLL